MEPKGELIMIKRPLKNGRKSRCAAIACGWVFHRHRELAEATVHIWQAVHGPVPDGSVIVIRQEAMPLLSHFPSIWLSHIPLGYAAYGAVRGQAHSTGTASSRSLSAGRNPVWGAIPVILWRWLTEMAMVATPAWAQRMFI